MWDKVQLFNAQNYDPFELPYLHLHMGSMVQLLCHKNENQKQSWWKSDESLFALYQQSQLNTSHINENICRSNKCTAMIDKWQHYPTSPVKQEKKREKEKLKYFTWNQMRCCVLHWLIWNEWITHGRKKPKALEFRLCTLEKKCVFFQMSW